MPSVCRSAHTVGRALLALPPLAAVLALMQPHAVAQPTSCEVEAARLVEALEQIRNTDYAVRGVFSVGPIEAAMKETLPAGVPPECVAAIAGRLPPEDVLQLRDGYSVQIEALGQIQMGFFLNKSGQLTEHYVMLK